MITFNDNGIYCARAGVYIDPWKPVDRAIITHAHSDHARWGMKHYLAHHLSVPVMKYRLGSDISVQALGYGEVIEMNGVKISLHPAGHIWGSAQVRLECNGEIWVVSGDYKIADDGISQAFEPVPCQHFITESTFGLPIYNFPAHQSVHDDINNWWRQNQAEGKNSVLFAYALGKAQRVISHLDPSIGKIFTHGAVDNVNKLYIENDGYLPATQRIDATVDKKDIQGAMIIAPPSASNSPWLRRFEPYKLGVCSGWMQLRGTRRRQGADRGFVLSDHADWGQLNVAVKETGASHIYVTHGYKSHFARWLTDAYHLNAREVETLYTGEQADDTLDLEQADNKSDESIQ
ncbi:MAG: ligase-associated DNA damage response exonuclease [Bacteroidetes bacterium]|nr:ligase-associated DNA damage response exonuclease [Bacteroidota bacterium]